MQLDITWAEQLEFKAPYEMYFGFLTSRPNHFLEEKWHHGVEPGRVL